MDASERWAEAIARAPMRGDDFLARVRSSGACFGEAPVCVHRTPYFLDARAVRRWARIVGSFHRIVRQARAALLADIDRGEASLAARIGVDSRAIAWARIDPGYPNVAPLARLDAFCSDGRPRFVELNAENPAGMGYADALDRVFAADPATALAGPFVPFDPTAEVVRTVRALARTWGIRTRGFCVAIVDRPDVPTGPEFVLLRDRFRAAGLAAEVVAPTALRFDGEALRAGDLRIDVVFRRLLVADMLARPEDCAALLAAYAAGRVCMINSLRTALLHGKGLFALLHDPDFPLSPSDRRFVERHVPWTGLLLGEDGDALRERALRDPARWVLKPLDGHGGNGVVLGWRVDARTWARNVAEARRHVLQERIEEAHGTFWDARDEAWATRLVDVGPFLARGRLAGFLCRVADGPLANVSSGGASQVPVLVDAHARGGVSGERSR